METIDDLITRRTTKFEVIILFMTLSVSHIAVEEFWPTIFFNVDSFHFGYATLS